MSKSVWAMVFAAGLGTRLRPYTNNRPKAMVEVCGKPLLWHCIERLRKIGVTDVVVNVHHLADQIIDYLKSNSFEGVRTYISDERNELLDTGGGLAYASKQFFNSSDYVIVHNVDIMTNCDLNKLVSRHIETGSDATLLVSHRDSSRHLVFNNYRLCGWENVKTGETKPTGFTINKETNDCSSFAGIHILGSNLINDLKKENGVFSIIDFYLKHCDDRTIMSYTDDSSKVLDVGKAESLAKAEEFLKENKLH